MWCLLLDVAGRPYNGTSAACVSLPAGSAIAQLKDAVKGVHSNKLSCYDAADLLVYRNRADFEKRNTTIDDKENTPMGPTELCESLGSKEDMIVVVVPSPTRTSSGNSPVSSLTGEKPNPKRRQRWTELNKNLQGIVRPYKTSDSTAHPCVTWNQVESVFNPTNSIQPRRYIDDAHLSFLAQYLSITTRCFGHITTGSQAKRLHFIAPILMCVCNLLQGDVEFVVEEDLVGNFVKARCHFEFMIRRGRKVICVIQAKKDDLEQGMVQFLIGSEVAAEVGSLDDVYGIVTNYIQWNFLHTFSDRVEKEECSLRLTPNGPERESLREIAEKIYGMLTG